MATAPRKNEPKIEADDVLKGIVEWVSIESPSHDAKSVNKVVDHVEGQFRDLGLKLERIPGRDGFGDILECKTPPEMSQGDGKGILVLAHLDTVHPIGMIEKDLKIRREGDSIFGPGIYDMKAGGYIAYYALRHLVRPLRPDVRLWTAADVLATDARPDAADTHSRLGRAVRA